MNIDHIEDHDGAFKAILGKLSWGRFKGRPHKVKRAHKQQTHGRKRAAIRAMVAGGRGSFKAMSQRDVY